MRCQQKNQNLKKSTKEPYTCLYSAVFYFYSIKILKGLVHSNTGLIQYRLGILSSKSV